MRIRPYIPSKDYEYVSKWIDNEKTHAFWCANLLPYPITRKSFHDLLERNAMDWTDSAYVATENSGLAKQCYEKIGFVERKIDKDVFSYKDELWSRCNMIISEQSL